MKNTAKVLGLTELETKKLAAKCESFVEFESKCNDILCGWEEEFTFMQYTTSKEEYLQFIVSKEIVD